jgi:hypothetical protein
MFICPPNLAHSFLTVCKIMKFKIDEKVVFPVPMENRRVLEVKKLKIPSKYRLCNFIFLFLSALGTCQQNLTPTRSVENWEKIYFLLLGMLKLTNKSRFLTIKMTSQKLLYWKSKQWAHALVPPLHTFFSSWKTLKSQFFGWYFKVPQANCFRPYFSNFGQILLHC